MSANDFFLQRQDYLENKLREYFKEKLEHNRIINSNTGCWHWMLHVANTGYGQIYCAIDGKLYSTHRIAMFVYGDFKFTSDKLTLICHKCPIRNCFNPDHLYIGDHHTNALDRVKDGNASFNQGENSGRTELTDKLVIDLRELFKTDKYTKRQLAEMFGIGESTVGAIIRGKTWKHLL